MAKGSGADGSSAVDAYIAARPVQTAAILSRIREVVRACAPGVSERISYGIPAFRLQRDILYVGAFKAHIGLYPPVR